MNEKQDEIAAIKLELANLKADFDAHVAASEAEKVAQKKHIAMIDALNKPPT